MLPISARRKLPDKPKTPRMDPFRDILPIRSISLNMLNILSELIDKAFRLPPPFHDTVLAENILINSDWQEIDTKDLIKSERNKHLISIDLELPYEIPLGARGIKTPNSEITNPEIILIDEENNKYEFTHYGAGGTEVSRYQYKGYLPEDKNYRKILIRSEFPIKAERILWTSFNIKHRK